MIVWDTKMARGGGGGGLPYEKDRDARRLTKGCKFQMFVLP